MTNAAARPPSSWEKQTVAVLIAIAASGLLGLIVLATQIGLWAYLRDDGTTAVSALIVWMIRHADAIDVLYLVLVVAYLGAFQWWRHQTRTMLRRVGDVTGAATVHWAVVAWGLLLGASFYLGLGLPSGTDARTDDELSVMFGWLAVKTALRLGAMVLLAFGVWQIRAQVRRAIAESGVALVHSGKPSVRTSPLLTPVAAAPVPGLPPADEEFWRRAGALAGAPSSASAGAPSSASPGAASGALPGAVPGPSKVDIAVLETVDALARRWALIPAGGDVEAVRAGIPAGAVVTVFAAPPAATATEGYTPPEAESYHGFLEDAASGALWYQSVTPKRVPAFLARARSAKRWALYPADAPDALTAVVLAPAHAAAPDGAAEGDPARSAER